MADIDIDPEGVKALMAFGDSDGPVFDLNAVASTTVGPPQNPEVPLPAGVAFRAAADEAGKHRKEFLTAVAQGLDAIKEGGLVMAASYSTLDQTLTTTMTEATTRDPALPKIHPEFERMA